MVSVQRSRITTCTAARTIVTAARTEAGMAGKERIVSDHVGLVVGKCEAGRECRKWSLVESRQVAGELCKLSCAYILSRVNQRANLLSASM